MQGYRACVPVADWFVEAVLTIVRCGDTVGKPYLEEKLFIQDATGSTSCKCRL